MCSSMKVLSMESRVFPTVTLRRAAPIDLIYVSDMFMNVSNLEYVG